MSSSRGREFRGISIQLVVRARSINRRNLHLQITQHEVPVPCTTRAALRQRIVRQRLNSQSFHARTKRLGNNRNDFLRRRRSGGKD